MVSLWPGLAPPPLLQMIEAMCADWLGVKPICCVCAIPGCSTVAPPLASCGGFWDSMWVMACVDVTV